MKNKIPFFMGSRLCHIIAYIFYDNPDEIEWGELVLKIAEKLTNDRNPNLLFNSLRYCIYLMENKGYIEQYHEYDDELKNCIENVTDKRVKDKVKYCLRKKRGSITNKIRPTQILLNDFSRFLICYSKCVNCPNRGWEKINCRW